MESIFLHVPTLFSDNGSVNSKHAQTPSRGGRGGGGRLVVPVGAEGEGDSRFQVKGMIKGSFGVKFFILGIFLGKKIWQVFFGVA